jgi:hypothetical protein
MQYFACSGGHGTDFIESASGHVTPNLCFFHLVGCAGHVVHSGMSGPQNVNVLFFRLGRAQCDFHKKCVGRRYAKYAFLHLVGTVGHVVHSGASGHETLMHYFPCSSGTVLIRQKNA